MSTTQARMKLKYREKHETPIAGELGDYLGRGDGRISGAIDGDVVWDLYESQGDSVCSANLVGVIGDRGEDRLEFNILGFFKRQRDSHRRS